MGEVEGDTGLQSEVLEDLVEARNYRRWLVDLALPHLGDGQDRTNAELSPAEKDAISHRGKAFRELAKVIAKELRD